MYKTEINREKALKPITVDITGLQEMLSVGRNTADSIGEAAGAVIRIGKRKLYNVAKIEAYMDKQGV
jgi:hypothetical protein